MDCLVENGTPSQIDNPSESADSNVDNSNDQLLNGSAKDEKEEEEKKDETKIECNSFPKHRYGRAELMRLRRLSLSKVKPAYLSEQFELEEGRWDPDKWFLSTYRSLASSELPPVPSNQVYFRSNVTRSFNNDNDRKTYASGGGDQGRNGTVDDVDVILGPQRKCFNTGCSAATHQFKRELSPRRDNNGRDRDRDRGGARVIGSGRVQISERRLDRMESRETMEKRGCYGDDEWKDERYVRGTDNRRDVVLRNIKSNQRDRSSEGLHRNDRHGVAASRSVTEAMSRSRNTRESTAYRGHTTEPEWFTHGPKNRDDRIELGGFRSDSNSSKFQVSGSGDAMIRNEEKDDDEEEEEEEKKEKDKKAAVKESRNSQNREALKNKNVTSTDSHDSSNHDLDISVVKTGSEVDPTSLQSKNQEFYFKDFFKLNDAENETASCRDGGGATSRFKAFINMRPSSRNSDYDETMQRTSLVNLFPYLNDDGGSELCLLPPSPPIYGHQLSMASEEEDRKKFLIMLEKANLLPNKDAVAVVSKSADQGRCHEFTADLKAMLRVPHLENLNQEKSLAHKSLPDGSKAVLAEELEADLMRIDAKEKKTEAPHSGSTQPRYGANEPLSRPIGPPLSGPGQLLNGGRVRTLAELEGLDDDDDKDKNDSDDRINDSSQMAAFNKLLDLVKPQTERTRPEGILHHPPPLPTTPLMKGPVQQQVVAVTSSADATSQCPSLERHPSEMLNHPTAPPPVTSSPVMFGSQPPTNLMTPLALRKSQDPRVPVTPNATVMAGAGAAINRALLAPHLEGAGVRDIANSVSTLLNTASTKTEEQEIIRTFSANTLNEVNSHPRINDATGGGGGGERLSPAFMPTAVMRKMAANRAVEERKSNALQQDASFSAATAAAVTDNEKMLYSMRSNHMTSAPVAGGLTNSQQMAAINQSQLIQLLKNHLSATAAATNQAHPAQAQQQQLPVDAMRGLHYPQMHIGGLEGPSTGGVNTRWPNTASNQDFLAQLKGHQIQGHQIQGHQIKGQGALPYPASLHQYQGHGSMPYQYQQQQQAPPSNMGPVDMAAVFQHLQNTSGQPMSSVARPPPTFSLNTAPHHHANQPVGRPIVKGTGFQQQQPHQNQMSALAAIQAILQANQQRPPPAAAPALHHHPPVLGTGGGGGGGDEIERWNQGQSLLNTKFSNNLRGMNPNHLSSSSLSSGQYDPANLSRLFGEDYLRRQQQLAAAPSSATTSQGLNMMMVKDIERRLGASSSSSSHVRHS